MVIARNVSSRPLLRHAKSKIQLKLSGCSNLAYVEDPGGTISKLTANDTWNHVKLRIADLVFKTARRGCWMLCLSMITKLRHGGRACFVRYVVLGHMFIEMGTIPIGRDQIAMAERRILLYSCVEDAAKLLTKSITRGHVDLPRGWFKRDVVQQVPKNAKRRWQRGFSKPAKTGMTRPIPKEPVFQIVFSSRFALLGTILIC